MTMTRADALAVAERQFDSGAFMRTLAQRIASGLALNDNVMLLAGAIPAAALALLVQGAFALGERRIRWLQGTNRDTR